MVRTLLNTSALAITAVLAAGAAMAQVNLTTATASAGNTPHATAHHMGRVASDRGIADFQVQDGATLTNTVLDVAEGRLDMSEAPMLLPFLLSRGLGPYSNVGAERGAELASNLRALYPYNAGGFGLFAMETANIDSWDDIAGRTIFNGPPRGAALTNARQAVQLAAGLEDGVDYTGVQVNWGQLTALLTDGSMDAFVYPTPHPSDRVITMQSAGNVVIVSTPREVFESEEYQRIFNMPGNIPIELNVADMGYSDGVRIVNADDGIHRALGTAFATVVHADMDDQLAYDLTVAHIETLDEMRNSAPFMRNAGHGILDQRLSGFCGLNQLMYHPAAVRAWEDHGYDVPDCAESAE